MKEKLILIICLIILSFNYSYTQIFREIFKENHDKPFAEIIQKIEEYYAVHPEIKDNEFKHYIRWYEANKSNIGKDGRLENASIRNLEILDRTLSKSNSKLKSSGQQGGNWTYFGPHSQAQLDFNNVGRINCIAFDPANSDIIYAGAPGGGCWRTTDGGNSWYPIFDGFDFGGVSGIAIDPGSPTNNRTIYLLSGDGDGYNTWSTGVFKSTDNGNTWMLTSMGNWDLFEYYDGFKLIRHPTNNQTYYAVFTAWVTPNTEGVYRTINGGVTWQNIFVEDVVDLEFKPGSPHIMYVSTKFGKIYKSSNAGTSWSQLTNGLPTPEDIDVSGQRRVSIAVTADEPDNLYALMALSGVYISEDEGVTFNPISSNHDPLIQHSHIQIDYNHVIAVSPSDKNKIIIGAVYLTYSTDGGQNWSYPNPSPHVDYHALEYNGSDLYAGCDGGIYKSTDDGANWTNISNGIHNMELYRFSSDPHIESKILFATQDNGVNLLEDDIFKHVLGGDGAACLIDRGNTEIFYAKINDNHLRKSIDNGDNWGYIDNSADNGRRPIVGSPVDHNVLYYGSYDLLKSNDKGDNFDNISNGQLDGTSVCIDFIGLSESDSNVVYVSKDDLLFKTTNGGATWTALDNYDFLDISNIVVHPENANILWITQNYVQHKYMQSVPNQRVLKSSNGGVSWTNLSAGTILDDTYDIPVSSMVYQKGSDSRVYISTSLGVFYRDDNTSDWIEYNNGMPIVGIRELEINYELNRIRAATYGRGIWESEIVLNCAEEMNFASYHAGTQNFGAEIINSSSIVLPNSHIKYYAREKIKLSNGFHVSKNDGATFFAQQTIRACDDILPPSFKSTNAKPISGKYIGRMNQLLNEETDADLSDLKSNFYVYPNPAQNNISVFNENGNIQKVEIYSINGNLVEIKDHIDHENIYFNISHYKSGIYIFKIYSENDIDIKKVVKE